MNKFIKAIKLSFVLIALFLNSAIIKSDRIPMDYDPYDRYNNLDSNKWQDGYDDSHSSFMNYDRLNDNGNDDGYDQQYSRPKSNALINELRDTKYCVGCDLHNSDAANQNLNHVDISHSNSANINLKNSSLSEAKAMDSSFEYGDLENIDARKSDFTNADFEHANATNANFSRSDLYNADFKEAQASKANFQRANLARADFTQADLRKADFKNAELFETEFEGSDRTGATWTRGEICLDRDCKKTSGGEFYEEITSLLKQEEDTKNKTNNTAKIKIQEPATRTPVAKIIVQSSTPDKIVTPEPTTTLILNPISETNTTNTAQITEDIKSPEVAITLNPIYDTSNPTEVIPEAIQAPEVTITQPTNPTTAEVITTTSPVATNAVPEAKPAS
ncbi:MAG: pentapeptide repeat-containing protein [Candidatus Babeliales bacterium]|nr:pentapeptide repeat-containing protein [Candidatus Babeliales bacterium]